ncbi:hypothetical protein OtV5_086 [Ostreococcus tauri virus OtV5]|uniref:Uncharacterized protein n=1 Tax=Ostreococcus tauri virus OtV5 TaxID=1785753 RepID=A9YVZ3_9PHYC|nr:hypothetical protein OtV5_086 [Ostreococcus tauri virus OtV5]ABY27876.1 hypothetical protein OtV5_086 [Ostreococcus tauri virus OtV5]
MKTPLTVVLTVIGYYIAIYGITLVPHASDNYFINLTVLTLVVPNLVRYIIGNVPRLAVDRVFMISTTVIAFIVTYLVNLTMKDTKEAVKDYGSDRSKTLKLSALLMTAFTVGALITYYSGIDNSIYSNMGWESNQGFTI